MVRAGWRKARTLRHAVRKWHCQLILQRNVGQCAKLDSKLCWACKP